ncbi:MAG: DUF5694 domain-containing protein [Hyphomonas sp.]|nr:hypothetical protein [Hyphomonas sp.]
MIRTIVTALAVLVAPACTTAAPATPETGQDAVQVMVLGTYHFANPGQDVVNAEADDMLAPGRQAELEALTRQLAAFHPTAIAVETTRRTPDLIDPRYAAFTAAELSENPNETIQIGYRLANELGIDRVYAIDDSDGEIDYFPFDRVKAFAERTGQSALIDTLIAGVQDDMKALEAAQATKTVSQLLAMLNDPSALREQHDRFYYGLLKLSDTDDHAGAALNYGWYARNAVIFSNLTEVARPGDRILVIYGAGHAYWLRHFAEETPGFELVEPGPYLTGQAVNGS